MLTSNYGAQYGRNGSGTVEVETKSGGTTFHGSAFEYLRNAYFNARSWEQGADPAQPKGPYNKNDWGYTFGGPVYIPNHYNSDKKKTFVFWSQEWRHEKNPSSIEQNVPSVAERGGNFSDLCPLAVIGPNVPNPAAVPITPAGHPLEALIPMPTPRTADSLQSRKLFRGQPLGGKNSCAWTKISEINIVLLFATSTILGRRSCRTRCGAMGRRIFRILQTNFVGPGSSFVARLNANFSPTLLNEFVASYTADHIFLTALAALRACQQVRWALSSTTASAESFPPSILGATPRMGGERLTLGHRLFSLEQRQPDLYVSRQRDEDCWQAHSDHWSLFRGRAEKRKELALYSRHLLLRLLANQHREILCRSAGGEHRQYQQTNLKRSITTGTKLSNPISRTTGE